MPKILLVDAVKADNMKTLLEIVGESIEATSHLAPHKIRYDVKTAQSLLQNMRYKGMLNNTKTEKIKKIYRAGYPFGNSTQCRNSLSRWYVPSRRKQCSRSRKGLPSLDTRNW